jgi:hypothetical protein
MSKETKVVNPINVKKTKIAVIRTTYIYSYYTSNRWNYLRDSYRMYKSYNRAVQYKYSPNELGSFRVCLKKIK